MICVEACYKQKTPRVLGKDFFFIIKLKNKKSERKQYNKIRYALSITLCIKKNCTARRRKTKLNFPQVIIKTLWCNFIQSGLPPCRAENFLFERTPFKTRMERGKAENAVAIMKESSCCKQWRSSWRPCLFSSPGSNLCPTPWKWFWN